MPGHHGGGHHGGGARHGGGRHGGHHGGHGGGRPVYRGGYGHGWGRRSWGRWWYPETVVVDDCYAELSMPQDYMASARSPAERYEIASRIADCMCRYEPAYGPCTERTKRRLLGASPLQGVDDFSSTEMTQVAIGIGLSIGALMLIGAAMK